MKRSPRRRSLDPQPGKSEADAGSDSQDAPDRASVPRLPGGRHVELPGRGQIFVREVEGPPGAPVVLLLHGWLASSGLNWGLTFETLGAHFRIVAPDQRGHGRGIRGWGRFRLEDCADDAAALLSALSIDSAIVVGYSMGGAVGQLLWRRHPERVAGLVMCATSGQPVSAGPVARVAMTSLLSAAAGTARLGQLVTSVPGRLASRAIAPFVRKEPSMDAIFAMAEMGRHDFRMLLEAGAALGRYHANDWLHEIDVPTAIVVTTEDQTVVPEGQMIQALQIRDVRIYCVDDGHAAVTDPQFGESLRAACLDVAARGLGALPPALRSRRRKRLQQTVSALVGETTPRLAPS